MRCDRPSGLIWRSADPASLQRMSGRSTSPDLATPPQRDYSYASRNWRIALAALAAFAFALFGQAYGAPWGWVGLVALPGVAMLFMWLMNARSGWHVGPEEVYFYHGHDWDLRLHPSRIRHVSVTPDSEGPDEITVYPLGASARTLPHFCVGKTADLTEALEGVGVDVRTG